MFLQLHEYDDQSKGVSECSLGQVEDRDAIAYWRDQRVAVWSEDEVALAIDCAQEV